MAYKNKADMYKYNNDFVRNNYDRVSLMLPKGTREKLKQTAKKQGESLNEYINKAIDQRIEREKHK